MGQVAAALATGNTVLAKPVEQTPGVAGVVFTGATQVAKIINRALAAKDGAIVPLVAETGGIDAMVVDSWALRVLCVQAAIAMLKGAANELVVGRYC